MNISGRNLFDFCDEDEMCLVIMLFKKEDTGRCPLVPSRQIFVVVEANNLRQVMDIRMFLGELLH